MPAPAQIARLLPLLLAASFLPGQAPVPGEVGPETPVWGSWRGPHQNGTSDESGLPDRFGADGIDWTVDLAGRGTPVVADGRVYAMAYRGEGPRTRELLVAIDEQSGSVLWEKEFQPFVTDTIYYRLAIGSPTVDPQTRNVYCLSNAGEISCFTPEGDLVWQHSMGEEYGRLTFPNGRAGAPLIVENLAIVHVITSAWGSYGPARDRFYAFDKRTGRNVWSSTPGGPPKDSSFSFPVVDTQPGTGRLVLYAGLGGGHMVCVDARTGEPIWRFPMATGGVNSSALLYGPDELIAIHGKENLDASEIGRMVSIDRHAVTHPPGTPAVVLGKEHENWRLGLEAFTSSPVLVGDVVYQTVKTGELVAVDARDGRRMWSLKLAAGQIHASPAYGDGKLYCPMEDGTVHIVRPTATGGEVLDRIELEGACLGAPAIANGRVYVHTTEKLYAFGPMRTAGADPAAPAVVGKATQIRIEPADALARIGDTLPVKVVGLDTAGRIVRDPLSEETTWKGLPGSQGVTESGDGSYAVLQRLSEPGSFTVTALSGDRTATARLRVVPRVPFSDDFTAVLKGSGDNLSAPPRPWWIGAGKKWEIVSRDGENVLAKTIDNPLFQRTMSYVGHPDESDYTMKVDILSDGNRRGMSSAGLVHQRYLIKLRGNYQELSVSSTEEMLKETQKFRWQRDTWYTLKTRVRVDESGTATIRVKCWPRAEDEPEAWTMTVEHPDGNTHGAPGIWGFVPQSRHRVYLDNLEVTSN